MPGAENRFVVWCVPDGTRRLTLLEGVLLEGNLEFDHTQSWNSLSKKFVDEHTSTEFIYIGQIYDYTAAEREIPSDIKF